MDTDQERKYPMTPVLTGIALLLMAVAIGLLATTVSLSGSTTLSNGTNVKIQSDFRGFSVAGGKESTTIQIAGREIEFHDAMIVVDGVRVADLDSSINEILVSSKGNRISLVCDGKAIECH